jgi:hypothetical protein
MGARIQIVMDCADPDRLVRFWSVALSYQVEDPPAGALTWREYWRGVGVPEDELGEGDCADSVVDPSGIGPRVRFQQVPDPRVVKNRLHLDIDASGGRGVPIATRMERVDAHVATLLAAGATALHVHAVPGVDHYAVTMADPEGNEFCVN